MKKRFKNYLKLGVLLLGISVAITSCQKDDDYNIVDTSASTPTPIVKNINFKEFLNQKNSKLTIERLNKLNKTSLKTSSIYNKDSNEQSQSITIDYSSIKQIIKNGIISYTFRIVQESNDNTFFKNLIIQTDSSQKTSAYIIKYIPDVSYDVNSPFQGVREVTPLDYSDINIYTSNNKQTTVCVTITTYINHYLCDPGVEQTPDSCDYQYTSESLDTTCTTIVNTYTYVVSSTGSGSGGGGSSSDDSDDPNEDPTDPNNHEVITSPVFEEEDECELSEENANLIAIYLASSIISPSTTPPFEAIVFADDAKEAICNGEVATFEEYVELMEDCNTSMEDLKLVFPTTSDIRLQEIAGYINEHGKDFGIDTKEELQHFLSQAGHESGNFTNFTEGLNYRVNLLGTYKYWDKYFNPQTAYTTPPTTVVDPTKKNPNDYIGNTSTSGVVYVNHETFANFVYCCRNGNGNEASGDGYLYRGRGIIQLTGEANYTDFNTHYQANYDSTVNLVTNPDLVASNLEIAVISALWFYKTNVLDEIPVNDSTTVEAVTLIVNGGDNGLDDREDIFEECETNIDCI